MEDTSNPLLEFPSQALCLHLMNGIKMTGNDSRRFLSRPIITLSIVSAFRSPEGPAPPRNDDTSGKGSDVMGGVWKG